MDALPIIKAELSVPGKNMILKLREKQFSGTRGSEKLATYSGIVKKWYKHKIENSGIGFMSPVKSQGGTWIFTETSGFLDTRDRWFHIGKFPQEKLDR